MKHPSYKLITLLAGVIALSPALRAQNENFNVGDLVLYFQKPGSDNTVYVGLGNAATLYRGSAAGSTADRQAMNIVNIATELQSAFGAGWASDPDIFAGAAACWSASQNTTAHLNGDPHRTLYTSQPRLPLGAPGISSSEPWDFTTSGFSGPATNILAMNNKLETDFTTRAAVSPLSASTIDDQNPIEISPGGSYLQPSAFGAFPGGVQQQGTASTLGAFGPAGQVEFALDLYRILPRITVSGQVDGPDKTGSFEGTVVVSTSGNVSFITQESVPAPELDVEQPEGADVASGGSVGFPNTISGDTSATKTFFIRNNGDGDLTGLQLSIGGTNGDDFLVTGFSETSLVGGGFTTFTVSFVPQAVGARSATLQIASNDADENPYIIQLGGTGTVAPSPEISVVNPAEEDLVDGTATAKFKSVTVGLAGTAQTFTIRNLGDASLTGLSISKSGNNPDDFTATPLSTTSLTGGTNTTFSIRFTPKAAGKRSATLLIGSNDADENPFEILLSGTALKPVPEIEIFQKKGSPLVDDESKVSFGTGVIGMTGSPKTFTISNVGTADLIDLAISNSDGDAKDFLLSKLGKTTLAKDKSTTFTVTFKPSAKGTLKTTLRVKSSDADENPFEITLTGMGTKN